MRKRRKNHWQFGLKSLFGLMTLVAVVLWMELPWYVLVYGAPVAMLTHALLGLLAGWTVDAIDWLLTKRVGQKH